MKIFDAHCHIYPKKIAQKAALATAKFYGNIGETYDGTVQTLFKNSGDITMHLVQSVATCPHQVRSINEFIAEEVKDYPDRLYGFGALHPESPDVLGDIRHLQELGLHGAKLHPDIQGFSLTDKKVYAMCEACEGVLPLLIHTGDRRYSFSNPEQLIPLLKRFPKLTVIGAHFGGWSIWEEATKKLAGRFPNLWVDCSSSFFAMSRETAVSLIDAYTPERVLFGTDYPMWNPGEELEKFLSLDHPGSEDILWNNASRLFHLE